MSQLAPFVDAATSIDPTNFENTVISYYTWGEAIGLALDLTLRDRSDGKVTLDHFMRALWQKHGKPGGRLPGYVDNPYTMADAKSALAEVSGDAAFADDFFARYIEGREVVDYARLLARAGLMLRPRRPGQGFAGAPAAAGRTARCASRAPVPFGSPAYAAGLERDDVILSIGGAAAVERRRGRARDPHAAAWRQRCRSSSSGAGQQVTGTLAADRRPARELVPAEQSGQPLTPAQRRFRDAWLSSANRS